MRAAAQRARELLVLLDLFEHCRYPLLIHCKSGSDRTGLASALYLMSRRGEPPGWAVRGFTLKHGHVPLFGPEHLHEPFREYEAWLKAPQAWTTRRPGSVTGSSTTIRPMTWPSTSRDSLPALAALFEVDKDNGMGGPNPGSGTKKAAVTPGDVPLRGWGWKTRSGGA